MSIQWLYAGGINTVIRLPSGVTFKSNYMIIYFCVCLVPYEEL